MLLEQDIIQLKEWGNSSAFRIPQKLLKSLGFESNQEFSIKAVESSGHRQLVIEPVLSQEEKVSIVESMSGILAEADPIDVKEYRRNRKEERLKKYESLT
ncbi:AbrB/MazE/SpoVT family DNA-binding domain-containing protein [Streptococcus henryi]|jgi:antitoxin MazE|uniref:AbrB/MazE/SpoVT family DNA-binding domain-containing protein n=1 Tax=Streptococcus henryi TaxID=439219 RepID=UPI00036D5482|nr:hypothetical protein [Streptococcus henryi]